MSSSVNILRNMVSFDKAEQFDGFSKVRIIVSDEIEYSAGTDTGRTITLNCPWGNQEIANNILQSIKGFQYQPMTAENALVDPSVEIGDGISANGVYSGVYSLETKFDSNLPTSISAPADEELYEEHTYIPKTEREVTRKFLDFQSQFKIQDGKISAEVEERKSDIKTVKSTLDVQANQIVAKVNKVQENTSTTFGWALETDSWRIFAGSSTVLKATKDGLEVKGKITATSGKIGNWDIKSNYLSYNGQTWGGTNTTGAYIGQSGIQLGRNFSVDMQGNLYAYSGTFAGDVYAGNIQYGGGAGYLNGSGLASHSVYGSQIGYNTISTSYTSSGINTSLGYADFANGVFNGWNTASSISASAINATSFRLGGTQFTKKTISFVDGKNITRTYVVLAEASE